MCVKERERFEFQVQCMGCECVCVRWRFEFQVQCMGCECECVCVGGLNFRFSVWGVCVSVYMCVRLRAVPVLCITLGSTGVLPH